MVISTLKKKAGFPIDENCSEKTSTPLQIAIGYEHENTARVLVSLGASVLPVSNSNNINNCNNANRHSEDSEDSDGDGEGDGEGDTERDSEGDSRIEKTNPYDYDEYDTELEDPIFINEDAVGMVDGKIDPFVLAVSKGYFSLAKV